MGKEGENSKIWPGLCCRTWGRWRLGWADSLSNKHCCGLSWGWLTAGMAGLWEDWNNFPSIVHTLTLWIHPHPQPWERVSVWAYVCEHVRVRVCAYLCVCAWVYSREALCRKDESKGKEVTPSIKRNKWCTLFWDVWENPKWSEKSKRKKSFTPSWNVVTLW